MQSDSTGYGSSSANSSYYSLYIPKSTENCNSHNWPQTVPRRTNKFKICTDACLRETYYSDGSYHKCEVDSYDDRYFERNADYDSEAELCRIHSSVSSSTYGSYFQTISTEDDSITYHYAPTPRFLDVRFRTYPERRWHVKSKPSVSRNTTPPRPSCTPGKAITNSSDDYKTTIDLEYDEEDQRNSIRFKSPKVVSIRSSMSNQRSLVRDMSEAEEPYTQRIEIDPRSRKICDCGIVKAIPVQVEPLVHELAMPITSVPPPKPPRAVDKDKGVIKLRKASTFRHERPAINASTFESPSTHNHKIIKRSSINVCSPRVSTLSEDRRPSTTTYYPASTLTRSILKRPPRYENRCTRFFVNPNSRSYDPSDALFGPVEHIYERIDSDSTSSDEEHQSARIEQDLRPEPPPRPRVWPFKVFPPDMTFQPRSYHAYHRKYSNSKRRSLITI